MAKPTIVTRLGKGSELTFQEGDDNFTNLRDATVTVAGDSGTAQAVDLNGTVTVSGGTGLSNTILGYTRWFAGGGGGWNHSYYSGTGGLGGGGLGLQQSSWVSNHANAAPNSGGGGGGGGHSNGIRGGNGATGIVVIRTQIVYSPGGIG